MSVSVRTLSIFADSVEFRHLRYALLSAELQSFAKASAYLGIKQATLSRHISFLERRFGAPLFRRSPRGVRPTEAGSVFLESARRVLNEMEGLYERTRAVSQGSAGTLALGFLTSLSAGNLRSSLFAFMKEFPEIEVRCSETDQQQLVLMLGTGALDIIVASYSPVDLDTHQMSLWSEQLHVVLPRDHPLAIKERVFWSDLYGETVCAPRMTADYVMPIVRRHLGQAGTEPKIIVSDASRETVIVGVGAGRNVSITSSASTGLKIEDVVFRPLFDINSAQVLNFSAYWRGGNRNPAMETFLNFLRQRYSLPSPES